MTGYCVRGLSLCCELRYMYMHDVSMIHVCMLVLHDCDMLHVGLSPSIDYLGLVYWKQVILWMCLMYGDDFRHYHHEETVRTN